MEIVASIFLAIIMSAITVTFAWLVNEKDRGKSKKKKDDST